MDLCRFKITHEKLGILNKMYNEVLRMGVLDGRELLLAHVFELKARIRMMRAKRQYEYQLSLKHSEAVAFKETWELAGEHLAFPPDCVQMINSSVAVADKYIGIQGVQMLAKAEDDEEDDQE